MALPDGVIDRTKSHEGLALWPYLDTAKKPQVTIGYGHVVVDVAAFKALPLVGIDLTSTADPPAKQQAWDAIQGMVEDQEKREKKDKHTAAYYASATAVRVTAGEALNTLTADLEIAVAELKKKFPHYDGYPAPGQAGLIDMIFNMGATRFTDSLWPRLFAAMNAKDAIPDWNGVAAECERPALNSDRNKEIKELFLAAAQQQPKKP